MKQYELKGWRARVVLYSAMAHLITIGVMVSMYLGAAFLYYTIAKQTL